MRRLSPSAIGQVDLEILFHMGQSIRGLDAMISQVTNRVLRTLERDGTELSKERREQMVSSYRKEALATLPSYRKKFSKLQDSVATNERIHYSKETDLRRFQRFYRQFKTSFLLYPNPEQFMLPSWKELSSSVNYFAVSSLLRRRSNQSTFSRLNKAGLL